VDNWIAENSSLLLIALAATSAVLLVLSLVLLVAWLRSRRGRNGKHHASVDAELDRIDLELSLAEQTGRLRMIRELHEVAVHDVSVIISQADGARYASQADPTAAVRSVAVIAEAARSTLADLRRVMTLVREGEADVAPQPRLKSMRDLFKVMREAGLVVSFEEVGEKFDLGQGAELAIYRILQESLSNALKHGGEGTEVKVTFSWTDDSLHVTVDDDGVRSAARRAGLDPNEVAQQRGYDLADDLSALTGVVSGVGITEMRDRAAMFGGVLHANAVPGVGFSVSVVFPALKYHNGIHGVNLGS
jgi:signal transduction histidine kinase